MCAVGCRVEFAFCLSFLSLPFNGLLSVQLARKYHLISISNFSPVIGSQNGLARWCLRCRFLLPFLLFRSREVFVCLVLKLYTTFASYILIYVFLFIVVMGVDWMRRNNDFIRVLRVCHLYVEVIVKHFKCEQRFQNCEKRIWEKIVITWLVNAPQHAEECNVCKFCSDSTRREVLYLNFFFHFALFAVCLSFSSPFVYFWKGWKVLFLFCCFFACFHFTSFFIFWLFYH